MLKLEVLRARHGDSLLLHYGTAAAPRLILIDGGPPPTYADALRPRLDELRAERAPNGTLDIDLMMVSHIDEDHIGGMLKLANAMKTDQDDGNQRAFRFKKAWYNAFDDVIGNKDPLIDSASIAASVGGAGFDDIGSLVLASVGQGQGLRDALEGLAVPINGNAALMLADHKETLGNITLRVVGPSKANLKAFRDAWDKELKKAKKKKGKAAALQLAAYLDKSPYNLSSIVVVVEENGKPRILLTGDGRGDHTIDGLEEAGLLKQGKLEVDVLKLPHHGSDRNIDDDYFAAIRAKHYVISADGKFNNPDEKTLQMIVDSRTDDDFTIHLTYPLDGFTVKPIGEKVDAFIKAQKKKGRKFKVGTRAASKKSFTIDLS